MDWASSSDSDSSLARAYSDSSLPWSPLITLQTSPTERENFQFVEDAPEDYNCGICYSILQEPNVTECCGQHFCRECLEVWKRGENNRSCPHCRKKNFRHMIYKPLQRRINESMVYCEHYEEGCSKTMKLIDLKHHLSVRNNSGCDYTTLTCPVDPFCSCSILRKDVEDHCSNVCDYRSVECTFCKKEMVHHRLKRHHNRCPKYLVTCPRKCTKDKIAREELEKHNEDCPKMTQECLFYEVGCTEDIVREDYEAHLQANTGDHLHKVMLVLMELKDDHYQMNRKVGQLEDHVDSLEEELAEVRRNIPHTKRRRMERYD